MTPILILRPEPGASATAERARALGLTPIVAPLFKMAPIDWSAPDSNAFDAVLMTSANAARLGGGGLRTLLDLPVHAVGAATAESAKSAGFRVASIGDQGLDALLERLDPRLHLLHLAGQNRREPTQSPHRVTVLPVYASSAIPDSEWHPGKLQNTVALVHSPRAADLFGKRVDERGVHRSAISIAAISEAAAEAAGGGWKRIEAVSGPTDDALLALAARLCDSTGGE